MEEACTVIAKLGCIYPVARLKKLFSRFGSVKHIRVANPKNPNLPGCSTDVLKEPGQCPDGEVLGLHVIVQYDTAKEARSSINSPWGKKWRVRPKSYYCVASECDLDHAENDMNITTNLRRRFVRQLFMMLFE